MLAKTIFSRSAMRHVALGMAVMLFGYGARVAGAQSAAPVSPASTDGAPTVIEVLADHDSRYKIAGMKDPAISVHAGQMVTLKITAVKAKDHARDGAIHGFSLLRAKDRSHVPGWDFRLKPGAQTLMLKAPDEPGEYVVVCTVICSADHEGMHMKFVVLP
jgi:heme/copper-type cytochrome/quinol oxidase subunit 2